MIIGNRSGERRSFTEVVVVGLKAAIVPEQNQSIPSGQSAEAGARLTALQSTERGLCPSFATIM